MRTRIIYTLLGIAIGAVMVIPMIATGLEDEFPNSVQMAQRNGRITVTWEHANATTVDSYRINVWEYSLYPGDGYSRSTYTSLYDRCFHYGSEMSAAPSVTAERRSFVSDVSIRYGDDFYCAQVCAIRSGSPACSAGEWVIARQIPEDTNNSTSSPATQPNSEDRVNISTSSEGFSDVSGNSHIVNIDRLADIGITRGCNSEGTKFCPNRPVTRAEMATFMIRLYDKLSQ